MFDWFDESWIIGILVLVALPALIISYFMQPSAEQIRRMQTIEMHDPTEKDR